MELTQGSCQGDKVLARGIVQFPCDSPPLLVLQTQEMAGETLPFRFRPFLLRNILDNPNGSIDTVVILDRKIGNSQVPFAKIRILISGFEMDDIPFQTFIQFFLDQVIRHLAIQNVPEQMAHELLSLLASVARISPVHKPEAIFPVNDDDHLF